MLCFNSIPGKGTYFYALHSVQNLLGLQMIALFYVSRGVSRFPSKQVVSVPEPHTSLKAYETICFRGNSNEMLQNWAHDFRSFCPVIWLKQLKCSADIHKIWYRGVLVIITTKRTQCNATCVRQYLGADCVIHFSRCSAPSVMDSR